MEVLHDIGLGNARHAVQAGPDEHRLPVGLGMALFIVAVHVAQAVAQHVEGGNSVLNQFRMICRLRPRGAKHQPVFKGVALRVIQIGMTHCTKIDVGITGARSPVEMLRKINKASAHDFGKQVIATIKVPVRRLVRDAKLACDIAHAQVFHALLSDHFSCRLHASFLERCGLLDCLSHGFLMKAEA